MKRGIISVVSLGVGIIVGAIAAIKNGNEKQEKAKKMSDKHLDLYLLMDQWVAVKQEGKNLSEYFERKGYKSIAIYGMSYVGKRLVEELKGSGIEIKYGIDKNANNIASDLDIYSIEDDLMNVDVIVVTPITFFDEIEEKLSVKYNGPIISLDEIVYGI